MNDIHRLLFDDQYSPSLSLLLAVTTTRKRQEKKVENRSQMLFIFILFVPRWRRNGSVYRMESSYSPILKYSHRNRTDTRSVSFLYPPVYVIFRFQLHSSLIFPSPLCESMNLAQVYEEEKDTLALPSLSLSFHTRNRILMTIRDFETCSRSVRILYFQFQRLFETTKSLKKERERERGF